MAVALQEEWEFWEALSISRLPLSFILDAKKRAKRTQMRGFSETAFVHRMLDLFFTIRQDWVVNRLAPNERQALAEFEAALVALPWKPIESHPHVSDVPTQGLQSLVFPARRLDHCLALRTGGTLIPVVYRLMKGWKIQRMPRSRTRQNAS